MSGDANTCNHVSNRIPGYARVLSVMMYILGRTAQSTSEWKCSPLAALGSSGGMRIEAFPSVVGKSERGMRIEAFPLLLASQSAPQASAAYLCTCPGLCGCRTFEAAAGCPRSSARIQARSGGPSRRVGRSTRSAVWRCLPGPAGSLLRRCIPRARLPALRRALHLVLAPRRQCLFLDKDTQAK